MEDISNKVIELGEQMKVANHRISDLEAKTDRIETLTLSVQSLAFSVEQMAKDQAEYRSTQKDIATRLLSVETRPEKEKASKLDRIAVQLFTLVFGALVSYLLYNILGL